MEQEVGYGWTEGVHADDLDRSLGTYREAIETCRPFQMEYRLRAADGEYRWVRDEGVPRFGPGGVLAGYIGSCIDVTDIKRAHEELLARQKLESLGVLAGGIAHDFNNLLGSILADAELAAADLPSSSPAQAGIGRINAVARRAGEIVRELLAYAGEESGETEAVDMPAVVAEMVELLKISISKRAKLIVDLPRELPAVRANVAQIRQVVLNLVTNASEALGSESGTIAVATSLKRVSGGGQSASPPDGDYVELEISDTGVGMTDEVVARIFDPFFSTKFAGRGLGLAVVQGIVRRHGGVIRVNTAVGRGTTFQVLLPSVGKPAPATARASAPRPEREPASAGGTVVFVEDEPSLQVPVSILLRKHGYTVIEARDGLEAVELFRANQQKIDAVLLDMTLPGKSGSEVYSELLAIRPDVKVIFTTAYSRQTALIELAGQEGWAFIRKPYQPSDLVSLLQRVCRGAKTAI
jgi:signal transduction histidine kinase/ActR/RegA family two-component response regulator